MRKPVFGIFDKVTPPVSIYHIVWNKANVSDYHFGHTGLHNINMHIKGCNNKAFQVKSVSHVISAESI